jgi:HD-like signal output (HDOD) protein
LLNRPELRSAIGGIRQLPTTPSAFVKLQSALARDDLSTRDVADIVEEDPAITARLLQLVNSSFFRLARRITNVERAVAYLGFNAIRNLVLSAEVFSLWPARLSRTGIDLERRQLELQRLAACAHALTTGSPIADDTLLAALLQDIGYWVLAQDCSGQLEQTFQISREEGIPEWEAERRIIGASHAEIGAYLLGLWGLPHAVIEAVAYHHTPAEAGPSGFTPLAALTIARHYAANLHHESAEAGDLCRSTELDQYLESVGAPFDRLEAERLLSRHIEWPEMHAVAV